MEVRLLSSAIVSAGNSMRVSTLAIQFVDPTDDVSA